MTAKAQLNRKAAGTGVRRSIPTWLRGNRFGLFFLALLVGVGAGFGAIALRYLIYGFTRLATGFFLVVPVDIDRPTPAAAGRTLGDRVGIPVPGEPARTVADGAATR